MMMLIQGCLSNSCTKPTFPKPTIHTMDKVKGLKDKEVDSWIIELYKLKLKLEED